MGQGYSAQEPIKYEDNLIADMAARPDEQARPDEPAIAPSSTPTEEKPSEDQTFETDDHGPFVYVIISNKNAVGFAQTLEDASNFMNTLIDIEISRYRHLYFNANVNAQDDFHMTISVPQPMDILGRYMDIHEFQITKLYQIPL